MRSIRILGVFLSTLSLTACLNMTTLVKVNADGSGTVEQTMLVNMAAARGLMGAQGQGTQQSIGPVMSQADLERMAASMGKGVKLVSREEIKGDSGFEGTKAIFSFADINDIQINQSPSGGSTARSAEPTQNDPVRFKLARSGGTSTLSINFIDRPSGDKPETPTMPKDMDLTNPMIMNMLKTMFQGFKINIGLEVGGKIVKTNAEYVNGSHITLLDMDVVEVLSNEAALKAMQGKIGPGMSFSEMKPLLKDVKGIKIDGPSITVQFR
jgi:hypothetical protein